MLFQWMLLIHSCNRYIIVLLLVLLIARGYKFRMHSTYYELDKKLKWVLNVVATVQLFLGLYLYVQSPWVKYFIQQYPATLYYREARFFSMEHSTVMFLCLLMTVYANIKSTSLPASRYYRRQFSILLIILIVIFVNVPWPFSPIVARPWFRGL